MRKSTRTCVLLGVVLLWAHWLSAQAVPGPAQSVAPPAAKVRADRSTAAYEHPLDNQMGKLVAGCTPLATTSIDTVMRRMEEAKISNDPQLMRNALSDGQRVLGEIVDRMENCVAQPGTFQQELGQGGFAPPSRTGGTPGKSGHGGAVKSYPPPEHAPGGEGNWPAAGTPEDGRLKP